MPKQDAGISSRCYNRQGDSITEFVDMIRGEVLAPQAIQGCSLAGRRNKQYWLRQQQYVCAQASIMPCRCRGCRQCFSCRTNTAIESFPLPSKSWVLVFYLEAANLKGVSSMKLHRDLGVLQCTDWFMLQRIREGLAYSASVSFAGPVEVDEANSGGILDVSGDANSKATSLGYFLVIVRKGKSLFSSASGSSVRKTHLYRKAQRWQGHE